MQEICVKFRIKSDNIDNRDLEYMVSNAMNHLWESDFFETWLQENLTEEENEDPRRLYTETFYDG